MDYWNLTTALSANGWMHASMVLGEFEIGRHIDEQLGRKDGPSYCMTETAATERGFETTTAQDQTKHIVEFPSDHKAEFHITRRPRNN